MLGETDIGVVDGGPSDLRLVAIVFGLERKMVWVVATQIFLNFTPKIGEMIQFD